MSQYLQQMMAAVARADRKGALDLATAALAAGEHHPLVLMLAAERLEETGDLPRALELLREAVPLAPEEPELLRRLGLLSARQGLLAEGRAVLEQADALRPDQPTILSPLGGVCLALGALDAAERTYRRLAALLPDDAAPLAALAAVAARQARHEEARNLADRALALDPGNIAAAQALARLDLDAGDAASAERLASQLLDRTGAEGELAIGLLGLRADARDKLGHYQEAFADYVARNEQVRRQSEPLLMRQVPERRVDEARRLTRHFETIDAFAATDPVATMHGEPKAHLFVVGFPRSGTTLLEKALAGHSEIVTLPEIDCLAPAAGDLLSSGGLSRLSSSDPREIAARRAKYFDAARQVRGDLVGRVLVDKLPLHSVALPAIVRLFPDAKVVLSLRDPRDVVLSCIRRRFQMNAAMFELLRPDEAVDFYDAVMTLLVRYREVLPIDLHEVRHERLVAAFEEELRRVLGLVDLDWQPSVAKFEQRAAAEMRTPSDLQLTRGLNSDGVGYWRRYAAPLAALLPRLDPWAVHYGYGA